MKRLLKYWFGLYSILVCIITALPLIIFATLLKSNHPFLFHILLFLTGWLVWTWIEYHVHRFLLHSKTEKWKTNTSQLHQHHHIDPGQFEIKLLHRILLFVFTCVLIYIAYIRNDYFTFF